jgi:hypothetical protein
MRGKRFIKHYRREREKCDSGELIIHEQLRKISIL